MALDDRYANKFAPLDSTAIYPKPGHKLLYTPMTGEMKCPIGYTFALCILIHLLQCRCNTCTNMINNDMIHFISLRDHIGSSILTSLAFHRCLRPSAPSLDQASPPRGPLLQSLQLALHACNRSIKPSHVLIFSPRSHDSMSCLMCNELLHHMCELCNKSKPSSLSWHGLLTHDVLVD